MCGKRGIESAYSAALWPVMVVFRAESIPIGPWTQPRSFNGDPGSALDQRFQDDGMALQERMLNLVGAIVRGRLVPRRSKSGVIKTLPVKYVEAEQPFM